MAASRCRIRPWMLLLVLLAACADRAADAPASRDASRYGGTVVIVNNDDLDNLNALVAAQKYSQEVNQFLLFLPLLRHGPALEYQPALAASWQVVDDTAAIFHLRRDVRWHDGAPTTARDVVFTFERALQPETTYPSTDNFSQWTGVHAVDSFTVHVSFRPHAEPLAGVPYLPIMPAHLLDSIPAAAMRQAPFNKRPVGNGPFRFVEYRANDRWVFEANPDFPAALGGRPYVDRLVWRVIPDPIAQVAEISTGAADVALTPPADDYPRLSGQQGLRGVDRPSRQYAMIIWNGRVPPLDNARVRQALTLAVDRARIVQTLRAGHGTVAVGPVAPDHWAFDPALQPLPFDPDSARTLLRAAGLVDRNGDGVLNLPDGRPFRIELKMPAGSAINRDMAELIRADLAAVGVRVVTRPTDVATMQQDVISPQRNFQAVLLAWNSSVRPNLRNTFHSAERDALFGFAGYANPRVDSLIDGVQFAHNRDEAAPLYAELQRLLRDEQPWGFLYYYSDLVLLRDRVQDVHMDVRGALVNVRDWWVTDAASARGAVPRSDSAARSPGPAAAPAQ
jgi:peptide/nickel transport system substrate-binding protein